MLNGGALARLHIACVKVVDVAVAAGAPSREELVRPALRRPEGVRALDDDRSAMMGFERAALSGTEPESV